MNTSEKSNEINKSNNTTNKEKEKKELDFSLKDVHFLGKNPKSPEELIRTFIYSK